MKILLFTSRNISSTCGELRLIENRAISLFDRWGIDTEVVGVQNMSRKAVQANTLFASKSVYWANPLNPMSITIAYRRAYKKVINLLSLNRKEYCCVLLSGLGTLRYLPKIKRLFPDLDVYVDVHGSSEDIKMCSQAASSYVRKILFQIEYYLGKREEKRYLKYFDGTLVVSNALKNLLHYRYGCSLDSTYVIPCATKSTSVKSLEEKKRSRIKVNSKYSLDPKEILFVYSGGASPWQCIKETVDLFQRINRWIPSKLLVLSHSINAIREQIGEREGVIFDSLQPNQVADIVCAADYGIMLRSDCETNNVAFPNKFLEYVSCGVSVIATPYVEDVAKLIVSQGIGIIVDDDFDSFLTELSRFNRPDIKHFEAVLEECSFQSTLTPWVNHLLSAERA